MGDGNIDFTAESVGGHVSLVRQNAHYLCVIYHVSAVTQHN